jgi:hypothetical protein
MAIERWSQRQAIVMISARERSVSADAEGATAPETLRPTDHTLLS